jgi:hypothetical protein
MLSVQDARNLLNSQPFFDGDFFAQKCEKMEGIGKKKEGEGVKGRGGERREEKTTNG